MTTKSMPKKKTLNEIAKEAARELFTNGHKEVADNLGLHKNGDYLGGWCEAAVQERILKHLKRVRALLTGKAVK